MTPETSNAIVAVGTIILALCAIAALAFKFWTSPKPVESKIAILRGLVEYSCIAAVVIAGYSLTLTHKLNIALAFICALYNFLVQVALFALWPNPVLRRDVLSLVLATAFLAIIPTL